LFGEEAGLCLNTVQGAIELIKQTGNTGGVFSTPDSQRGGVPAYYKLYVLLAQKIRDGELQPGQALQSENNMTAEYGVSRITVRKALDVLEQEGLIVRRRGARTCVATIDNDVPEPIVEGPIDNLLTRGLAAKALNIETGWKLATPDARSALRLQNSEKCFSVTRLRSHADTPFSYSRIYVAPEAAQTLNQDDLGSEPILVQIEKTGLFASSADQTLSAKLAQDPAASALRVPIGSALIELRRIVFDKKEKPFLFQVSLYRPDKYEYNMRLSRDSATARPQWRHT
tara:strand:- start:322 stop:1176 length:855 start_codon:yes stop_codon:yes gene_type:complete